MIIKNNYSINLVESQFIVLSKYIYFTILYFYVIIKLLYNIKLL